MACGSCCKTWFISRTKRRCDSSNNQAGGGGKDANPDRLGKSENDGSFDSFRKVRKFGHGGGNGRELGIVAIIQ